MRRFRRKLVVGFFIVLIGAIMLIGTSNDPISCFSLPESLAAKFQWRSNYLNQMKFSNYLSTAGPVTGQNVFRREITKNCTPRVNPSSVKTPFKFYIYDLPSKFNVDIQKLMSTERKFSYCYNLEYCGTGEEIYQYNQQGEQLLRTQGEKPGGEQGKLLTGKYSVRNTHQFALEVIIHYKLLHSPYRTLSPEKADMFYIPAYTGLNCLTFRDNSPDFVDQLFEHLRAKEEKYFLSGKPHFSTLSKIQREQGSQMCTTLRHPDSQNVTFIAIEKESNPFWGKSKDIYGNSIIVAPYPGYVHFLTDDQDRHLFEFHGGLRNFSNSKYQIGVPGLAQRDITLFLAAGTRRSNHFRAKLIDQFPIKTKTGPEDFFKSFNENSSQPNVKQIMLITNECAVEHRATTIPWMRRSMFCLQPPGDSPTRKSIYDSVLSGCIPVLFSSNYKTVYPFERYLNYNSFTYTIDEKLIQKYNKTVSEIIQEISEKKVKDLFTNLIRVAKWFQYSMPYGDLEWSDDALTLIIDELAFMYGFSNHLT